MVPTGNSCGRCKGTRVLVGFVGE